ncbi:LysR family transcriptional regulator [Serratia sp. M24T3]|nr:LysR family transcriptional regulator [Serratia sp. M24T3]EIC86193.1 LysR family transcriptional regulator [Serratia sp. M24T3]
MFDWEDLRYFLAVAQQGSLSGAARALKVDHATVSRRLNLLEESLQVRLVDRLPRSCQLTLLGQQIAELAGQVELNAFAVERTARAAQLPLAGKVVISMPPVLAYKFLANKLFAFRQLYPDIQLSIASQAQSVSLSRREADIAVRLFRPIEPRSVARKIGDMAFALYASKDYEYAKIPDRWEFIAYSEQFADMPHQKWLLEAARERRIVAEVSDIISQYEAAKTGIGIAGLPCFIGDAENELQRVTDISEAIPFSREIWILVHEDLRNTPQIRAVMDFLISGIAKQMA